MAEPADSNRSIKRMAGVCAGLLLCSGAVAAQKVIYKCETPQGTVYSGQPCAASGTGMETMPMLDEHQPSAQSLAERRKAKAWMHHELRMNEVNRRYRSCLDNMTHATRERTKSKIARYRGRIERLQSKRISYSPTFKATLLAQNWRRNIQQKVASLQASIDSEKRIMTQTVANARSVCSARRRQATRELQLDSSD